jgi:hypothetical protein
MDASSYIMNRMNRRSQMVNLPTLLETLHSRNCSVKFLAIYDVLLKPSMNLTLYVLNIIIKVSYNYYYVSKKI